MQGETRPPLCDQATAASRLIEAVDRDYRFLLPSHPLERLNLDYLADACDSEVAPAHGADHDRGVRAALLVDSVLSIDPRVNHVQRSMRVRTPVVVHLVSLGDCLGWAAPDVLVRQ